MSSVTPKFLRVLPDDIARVGFPGACILALVRYVTSLPGESNGRRMVDGLTWWRASQADIGQSLGGVPRDTVRRALVKLQQSGDLLSIPTQDFYGDSAHAYRASDQPLCDSAHGSDQQLCETAKPIVRNRAVRVCDSAQSECAIPRNLPISEELEEELELEELEELLTKELPS